MTNRLIPENFILQKLNQYSVNNSDDYLEAINIIAQNLNVGLKEISEAINNCKNKYDNYNYVDIFCEIQKIKNLTTIDFKKNYILKLTELIELYLIDSQMILTKIKATNKKNKILHLILELHENQFFIETYSRALRDYM